AGPDNSVRSIGLQADGSVLIGGLFTSVNGSALSHIARLAPDGSVDPSFNPGVGANDVVFSLVIQEDQKIMLGGGFTHASGVTRGRITRLNSDGSVDPTINFGAGANDFVAAIAIEPTSTIVIGGGFTMYDGQIRQHLARIYGRSVIGQGTIEFASAQYQVAQNGTNAVITVRRNGGTGDPNLGDSFITFQTSDDTAFAGINYGSVTTNLDFPVGETFETATVPIFDNSVVGPNLIVDLSLLNPVNTGLGGQNTATLTILNENSTVSFGLASYRVARNVGNGAAVISIVRAGGTIEPATVEFLTTTNGTALPGVDFLPVTNLVTFPIGVSTQSVAVPIINTNLPGGVTVDMILTNGANTFLLGQDEATLTILDNSLSPGNVEFLPNGYLVSETGTNAAITIIRTNGSIGQISVLLTVGGGGTAVPGVNYIATNSTIVFGDGETVKTLLVPVIYDPQITGPLTVNLTLSNPTGGAGIRGSSTSTLTINDVDVGVAFSQPGYFVNESAGSLTITVIRVGGTNTPFDVQYATTNATALAGSNYRSVSGSLHFSAGQTFQTFDVPILHNPAVQGNLIFFIGLSLSNSVARLGNPGTASVTVIDVDSGLSFLSPTNSVSKAGTNAVITVIRTGSTVGTVSVNFATSDGTAVSGLRYIATNGVLNFVDGQVTNSFSVTVINDNAVDGDQTVNLSLSNPGGGAQLLAPSISVLTIIDTTVGLSFSSANYSVNENGVTATITVLRTGVTNSTVSVNFATSDGTATAGNQYVATSGTLTFTNGQVSQNFPITIIDKNITGGSETVLLTLATPSSPGILVNPNAATLSILNNDGSLIVPAGTALISQNGPGNGIIEPGETVTIRFGFRNAGGTNTVNLVATLLAINGVTAPSGPQTYGVLVVNGPSVNQPFTFTVGGTNGTRIAATFKLQDGAFTTTNSFNFTLGQATNLFFNTNSITINDSAPATPYPATIFVSGLNGQINKVTVTVSNLAHTSLSDVVLLLVGPTGQSEVLMNDVAFHLTATNLNLTFDDSAINSLPASSVPTNGTYKPTVLAVAPNFPNPAPAGPYTSRLSDFIGANPNGTWLLYVLDDVAEDSGVITSGWGL
ncbi:MAG TPA: Calx-beta domain-containing protein, partial [Verrucomicrobiae bacterium]|nr:Calx-beta domain-containing protein [Verrucomicrobiae bacterium]